jgi:hypothetical protein
VNNNPIPAFSTLAIVLPSTITVNEALITCALASLSVSCSYNATTNTIVVSSISSILIAAQSLPPLKITNIFNPPSTTPTTSFKFYIINQFGQTIEYK